MKSASGPLIGNLAAFKRRITPGPASNKNTRPATTTAVAGPDAAGSGYGVPVPSRITSVPVADGISADEWVDSGDRPLGKKANQRASDKRITFAVCMRLLLLQVRSLN